MGVWLMSNMWEAVSSQHIRPLQQPLDTNARKSKASRFACGEVILMQALAARACVYLWMRERKEHFNTFTAGERVQSGRQTDGDDTEFKC